MIEDSVSAIAIIALSVWRGTRDYQRDCWQLFWRQRGDDFFEAGVPAQRVPKRQKF
jgi:hypothetical protein